MTYQFLSFNNNGRKFTIYPEFSQSISLDSIDLREFSKIGERHFEIVDNLQFSFDLKCRLLGTIWNEFSKKISLFFFEMIKNKTPEDFVISGRMGLFLALSDIELISLVGEKESEKYETEKIENQIILYDTFKT